MTEVLYGRQCVREALSAGRRQCRALLLAEGIRPAPILSDIARLAQAAGVPIQPVGRSVLDRVSSQHQGVGLEVGDYPYTEFSDALQWLDRRPVPLVLALDLLQARRTSVRSFAPPRRPGWTWYSCRTAGRSRSPPL